MPMTWPSPWMPLSQMDGLAVVARLDDRCGGDVVGLDRGDGLDPPHVVELGDGVERPVVRQPEAHPGDASDRTVVEHDDVVGAGRVEGLADHPIDGPAVEQEGIEEVLSLDGVVGTLAAGVEDRRRDLELGQVRHDGVHQRVAPQAAQHGGGRPARRRPGWARTR